MASQNRFQEKRPSRGCFVYEHLVSKDVTLTEEPKPSHDDTTSNKKSCPRPRAVAHPYEGDMEGRSDFRAIPVATRFHSKVRNHIC